MDILEDLRTTTFSNNEAFFKKAACEIEQLRSKVAELEQENSFLKANHKANLEAEQLRFHQAVAAQADNQRLRKWIEKWCQFDSLNMDLQEWFRFCEEYKEFKADAKDTSTLEVLVQKAGEVMRERCKESWLDSHVGENIDDAIRALPGVTLENLK